MRWRSELAVVMVAALIAAGAGCSDPRAQPLTIDGAAGAGGGTGGSAGTGGGGGGDAGVDSGGGSFCSQQTRPTGVAANDYRCFDLDTPSSGIGAWTQATSSAMAMLTVSNARALSAPSSLLMSIPAATSTAQSATLAWNDVGSTPIQKVVVSASFNGTVSGGVTPDFMGARIDLILIEYGNAHVSLSYTKGSDEVFQSGYTGYFINYAVVAGAAFQTQCQVTGNIAANLWNPIVLEVDNNGDAKVTMNGTTSATCGGVGSLSDTTANITIGPSAVGQTFDGLTVYVDDGVAAVYR